jgi:antitoxin component YwqK of YwqJK toxin-antitoxin module
MIVFLLMIEKMNANKFSALLLWISTLSLFSGLARAQQIDLIRDSILDVYMENGIADKEFIPKGKRDKQQARQGRWKDYEVGEDFIYSMQNGIPKQVFGMYMLYAEGKYLAGKREGKWTFYVIENKTLRKRLQKEVTYVHDLKEGVYTYYFITGEKGITGQYKQDLLDGTALSFYPNGAAYGTRTIGNDLYQGKHIYLYPDGKVSQELNYVDDTLHGPYLSYYRNGNPEELATYNMSQVDGLYQYFHPNGQLWIGKIFNNGKLMEITGNYDSDGTPREKGTLKHGNGTVFYYNKEGVLYNIVTYTDGIKSEEVWK